MPWYGPKWVQTVPPKWPAEATTWTEDETDDAYLPLIVEVAERHLPPEEVMPFCVVYVGALEVTSYCLIRVPADDWPSTLRAGVCQWSMADYKAGILMIKAAGIADGLVKRFEEWEQTRTLGGMTDGINLPTLPTELEAAIPLYTTLIAWRLIIGSDYQSMMAVQSLTVVAVLMPDVFNRFIRPTLNEPTRLSAILRELTGEAAKLRKLQGQNYVGLDTKGSPVFGRLAAALRINGHRRDELESTIVLLELIRDRPPTPSSSKSDVIDILRLVRPIFTQNKDKLCCSSSSSP